MPVKSGTDSKGPYYQWGDHGAKYHYTSGTTRSRNTAKSKESRQGQAAYANGYKGK